MAREKRIVIAFGRFNPPTTGHALLIAFLTKTANRLGADARVYASPTTDAKKNPLPFQEKVRFLRQLFPRVTFNDNPAMNTPFSAYADASKAGYKDITVIVGADRVRDFEKMGAYLLPAGSSKYNAAKHIDVSQYRVLAIPRGAGAISATLMRGYAVANDFRSFLAGTPGRNATIAKKIFTSVRRHMRIREQQAYRKVMQQKVLEAKVDHRRRPPIAGHPYHKKSTSALHYIIKDAGEAAKAMRGHDKKAEAKYLDQVNDASTVLNFRRRGGKQVKEAVGVEYVGKSKDLRLANEIHKLVTGRLPGWSANVKPEAVIDAALKGHLLKDLGPKWRESLKTLLNKATKQGIKWDKGLLLVRKLGFKMSFSGLVEAASPRPSEKLRVANEIYKLFTGKLPGWSPNVKPEAIIDAALKAPLSPKGVVMFKGPRMWRVAVKALLNRATELGIKWDKGLLLVRKLGFKMSSSGLLEAPTKLSRPASVSQQMQAAKIIAKSLTGSESRGLTGTGWKKTPHEIIDDAVRHFLKGRHTPKAWQIAGQMLNKATLLGIKWNQKLIQPTTRKAMKMDEAHKWQRPLPPYGDAAILAPGTWVKIPGRQGGRGKVVRYDKGDRHGSPFYVVDVGKYASERVPAHRVVREAANDGTRPVEPPSEVDRLKVRQTTDLLTLKQRQASELMAAKIRDVETKAREAQRKATAPKSAAVSAS